MKILEDKEYESLIAGYLEGQFQEWFALKTKLYHRLEIAQENVVENLICQARDYLAFPLLQYLKDEIDSENLELQVKRAIILTLNIHAPIKNKNTNALNSRKELLWLYLKKIFLDFESPQEFKAIIYRGYQAASQLNLPLKDAFLNVSHYENVVKKMYSPKAFQLKLEGMLSMFSIERLSMDYGFQFPPKTQKDVSCILTIPVVMKLIIEERIEKVFPPRRA